MWAFVEAAADLVAVVWMWAFLVAALVASWVGAHWWGYARGRQARGRATVLAAMEQAAAETITLPRQRQGVDR